MKRFLLVISLYIFVYTGSAFSQGLSLKSIELSISGGETSYSTKPFTISAPQAATPITGSMQLSSGDMGEARVNFYTTKKFGAEAIYGYQYSGVNFLRSSPTTSTFGVPLQIHTFGFNLLYYPFGDKIKSKWRPFVTLGGGAIVFRPSTGGQASAKDPLQGNFDTFFESSRPSGNGGIGVKRPLTKSIGFRADAGVVLTKVPTFGLPESSATSGATVLPVGGLVRSVRGSAGLIFYLGR
jgi:hypothetical protein